MAKIAFIGTGVMGAAMAGHLMDAGHDLIVYNRTKSKTDDLVARGASYAQSPKLAAEKADFVITIVGYPKDVPYWIFSLSMASVLSLHQICGE